MKDHEKILKELSLLSKVISFGVYKIDKSNVFRAWINFEQDESIGGNWLADGRTEIEAVEKLSEKIKVFTNDHPQKAL